MPDEKETSSSAANRKLRNRQSRVVKREQFRALTEPEKARQEALNTLRQYDRMVELINETLRSTQRFRLRPSGIQELNRISIKNIEAEAGRWRDEPIIIDGSRHQPPPWEEVPKHIDDLCEYVDDNWDTRSPFHLAAHVMWRLNWIHPFVDGNGRTTRAVSYYVMCAKLGFHMPGVTTVPELIAANKDPYYDALEAADEALLKGTLDVSAMERLLSDLLAKQMVLALERAEAPNPNLMENVARAREEISKVGHPQRVSRSTEALRSGRAFAIGAVFGGLALLFFMALVLLAVFGKPVPSDARYLVVIVLAFSAALSAGFLGGNASARGNVPLPFAQQYPLAIAFTGGVAVFVAVLILGRYLFM